MEDFSLKRPKQKSAVCKNREKSAMVMERKNDNLFCFGGCK